MKLYNFKILILLLPLITLALGSCSESSSSSSAPIFTVPQSANTLPLASAGQDIGIVTGQESILNGSNSVDADSDELTYSWAIISAPDTSTAALSSSSTANPRLTPDIDGRYIISLVVHDSISGSSIDFVTVTASPSGNTPPSCIASSNISATTGSNITINGLTSTDINSDPLTYQWLLEAAPDQSNAILSSTTIKNPGITPDIDGNYYLSLIINDGTHNSQPCLLTITSSSNANSTPVALAGPGHGVFTNQSFTINGSGSNDPDGSPLSYRWEIINSPAGSTVTLSGETGEKLEATVNQDGVYVLKLVVNDGTLNSRPKIIAINASSTAGIPQNVIATFSSICIPN